MLSGLANQGRLMDYVTLVREEIEHLKRRDSLRHTGVHRRLITNSMEHSP